jgi:DNA end-binding protein Ku
MRALKEKQLTGLAKIAIRNKEQLCALRPIEGGGLVMETLYYPDEIREFPSAIPDVEVSKRELDMAYALIDLLEEEFDAAKYHDEYRNALMEIIEAKLDGKEIAEVEVAKPAKVTDLVAALKASVEAAKKKQADEEEEEEEKPRRRKKVAAAG